MRKWKAFATAHALAALLAWPAVAQVPPSSLGVWGVLTPGHCISAYNPVLVQDAGVVCSGGPAGFMLTDGSNTLAAALNNFATASGTMTLPLSGTGAFTVSGTTAGFTSSSTTPFSVTTVLVNSNTVTQNALSLTPEIDPSGASLTNARGIVLSTAIANSSAPVSIFSQINLTGALRSTYTGQVAQMAGILINTPTVQNSLPPTEWDGLNVGTIGNGTGNTAGTITNTSIRVDAISAIAGAGGTMVNTAGKFTVPSGSSAGTTSRGLWITGNGGAASTKYALYSDSTAASQMAGQMQQADGTVGAPSFSFSGETNTGMFRNGTGTLEFAVAGANKLDFAVTTAATWTVPTAITLSSATVKMTAIAADTATADSTMCLKSSDGTVLKGTGTIGICLGTSSARFKHDIHAQSDGLVQLMGLKPVNFRYNHGHGDDGARPQYGFLAEDVVNTLPGLVGFDTESRPNSVDMLGMVPVIVKGMQEMQREIDTLKKGKRT